jgi:hypothetical protein
MLAVTGAVVSAMNLQITKQIMQSSNWKHLPELSQQGKQISILLAVLERFQFSCWIKLQVYSSPNKGKTTFFFFHCQYNILVCRDWWYILDVGVKIMGFCVLMLCIVADH